MGMVWEAYHQGVPLLGVPGITLDFWDQGGGWDEVGFQCPRDGCPGCWKCWDQW